MATYLGYPFDAEIFDYEWKNAPDPVSTVLLESGVMQENAEIANLIANGSDIYTVPFYKPIGGDADNYDGATNINVTDVDGAYQSGVVFGRAHGWREKEFVVDFNSGADPMMQIVSQVNTYWNKVRQKTLLNILNACFGATESTWNTWKNHVTDISGSGSVGEANKLSATSIADATVKACGDMAGQFKVALMHSVVANNLAKKDLLEFRKYTDPMGVQRQLNIADINGMTVVVSDALPVDGSSDAKYTTYCLSEGAIQHAVAPVKTPVEVVRDAKTNGGQNELITRLRETMLVNGFSYTKQSGDSASPTDTQLGESTRYSCVYDPKCIGLVKIVSNG